MVFDKLRFLPVLVLAGCGATSSVDDSFAKPPAPTLSQPTETVELPEAVNALAQDDRFLYAATETRVGAERATIHRIDKTNAHVEPLVDVPGRGALIPWLGADADGLYWFNSGEDLPGVWRADKDGGQALQLVATERDWVVTDLSLDGGRILYVETTVGAAPKTRTRSVAKSGGAPTDQPSIPGSGFVTDEAFVYSCAADGVYRAPKSGGPAERIGTLPCGKLERDGQRLSWLYNPMIIGHGEGDGDAIELVSPTGVYVMPVGGGVAPKLASGNIWALTSRGGEQFFIEYGDSPRRAVVRSTKATLVTVTFDSRTDIPAGMIVADEERVYWSEPREDAAGWHGVVRFFPRR
jgi:hypothetical protein